MVDMSKYEDFKRANKPLAKKSKLIKYKELIILMSEDGYSQKQIREYLIEKEKLIISSGALCNFFNKIKLQSIPGKEIQTIEQTPAIVQKSNNEKVTFMKRGEQLGDRRLSIEEIEILSSDELDIYRPLGIKFLTEKQNGEKIGDRILEKDEIAALSEDDKKTYKEYHLKLLKLKRVLEGRQNISEWNPTTK